MRGASAAAGGVLESMVILLKSVGVTLLPYDPLARICFALLLPLQHISMLPRITERIHREAPVERRHRDPPCCTRTFPIVHPADDRRK